MVERIQQRQSEKSLGSGIPERGTGRETGRARTPLTDEQRKERHDWIDDCMKKGKTQQECVEEWDKTHS